MPREAAPGEAPAPEIPLEKLLELPPEYDASRPGKAAGQTVPPSGAPQERAAASKEGVRVEVDNRRDVSIADPDRSRDQTDVGASIKLDETTRVKAGVRVERESAAGASPDHDATPRVGVEKRF